MILALKNKLSILLLILSFGVLAQEKATLSGYVKDAANGEGMIGVGVYIQELKVGIATNAYGFYSITIPKGVYTVSYTFIGYQKGIKKVDLSSSNAKSDIELKEDSQQLQEVVISTKKDDDNVKNIEMSVAKIDMKTIQRMPALLGEVDVIRSIQLLPGVSTVGEGSTGFNVRGGGVDQNLVLLDEAPVYNSSHLFGFFSVFNPDAVKDVKLIKGGIPAQYGGRISSILDVRMKEGNLKKTSVTGGIGTIFSRLSIEQPLKKDKGSMIVALRRSYIDVLAKPFLPKSLDGSQFYFYDFTAKANFKLNDKNTVFASGYFGRDVFGAQFGFNWGNGTGSARWNHVFNDKLFMNLTAFTSNYTYSLDSDLEKKNKQDSFRWNSEIKNLSLKPDFTFYPNVNNTITFGGQVIDYTFQPGKAIATAGGESRTIGLDKKYAREWATYVGNEQRIGQNLTLQYGLRYSFYDYLGKNKAYTFGTPAVAGTRKPLSSSKDYAAGELIQRYGNFEPRFSANIGLSKSTSIKMSYNRTAQYIHLLSNTVSASPLDVWTPSSNNIKPQLADQVALGVFKNFKDNTYEFSVEGYYKDLQNQIDYVPNSDLLLNPFVDGDLLSGKGRAYGAELYLKKAKGKFNGWVSYTLSRTERQVVGISQGKWFPSRFDKPQVLNVVALYDFRKRLNFSANFTYGSGTPATFPTEKFVWQGFALPNNYYDLRNSSRIPPYHRLDLSATLISKRKLFKTVQGEWVFSVYNVYNRRNPFSVYVRQSPTKPNETEAVRFAVFGSVLPAATYNFKF
jgi:TonB dependent receptor/CarboxypepD_reg-like domain/TonB-dependent Receptor Plug Domain